MSGSGEGGWTRLGPADTGGLCDLELHHPAGAFAPTPASRVAVRAVAREAARLEGHGLDWGSGIGVLALVAAHLPSVAHVTGLELEEVDVRAARANAERLGLAHRTRFVRADSYRPLFPEDRTWVDGLRGRVSFILANPPSSSPVDDGFGFRRAVVRGAPDFLRAGGRILLNVSSQYGEARVRGLLEEAPGFVHEGVVASTGWVPFDMARPDLAQDVRAYAAEEERGGLPYDFRHPDDPERPLTARAALEEHRRTGRSPLSRWQVHGFVMGG